MPKEVDPKDTTRAAAYALWMKAPNPMVTFFKTFDVTNLIKVSRKRSLKFNMLLDYCIGRAAVKVKEFYILPVGDKLIQYDTCLLYTSTYNGTYEVMQKTPKGTDYEIIIDGVTGYATVSPTEYYDETEIPTLPINIDGYSLYFIPKE